MGFHKKKYFWYSVSALLLVCGYWLMSSNEISAGEQFYESMFNFRRTTLAPIIIIGAYLLMIITIFRNRWISEKEK